MFHNAALRRTAMAPYDWALIWSVLALLGLGLVMVYSASAAVAEAKSTSHQPAFYLIRQGAYLVVGMAAAYGVFQLPSNLWQKVAPWLFFAGVVLLVAVLIPGIGKVVNGSRRWVPLGPLGNFQPSEFVKLFTVIYAADYTVRKAAMMHDLRQGFLPMFAVMVMVGGLLLLEPDFGAFVVIVAIALSVLFLGGFNARLFFGLTVMLAISFVIMILSSDYRRERLFSHLDPWKDPLDSGYQLTQSLIAFGRGEWLGVGLGNGVGKQFYLPESYTDFLLAVIGEELGFVGVAVVIGLFTWLIWRAFSIGWQAALMGRNFQALVAQGVAAWVAVQAFINMGVNLGLLPTKGLTLPLMSYGGSGIVANCLALALVIRIDFENRCLMKGRRQ